MKTSSVVLSLVLLLITGVSAVAIPVPPSATPDFSMSPSFSSLSIPAGYMAASTISLSSLNGFNGTVTLQPSLPLVSCSPQCTTWSLSPLSVPLGPTLSGTATLIIIAGTLGGSGNITVTGTSGGLVHSSVVEFIILVTPDFALGANPNHVVFPMGSSGTSTITELSTGGFNGIVIFTLSSSPGILAEIVPGNVTGSGTAVLFLSSTLSGNYTAVVTGTSGSLVHSVALLITATRPTATPDFTINSSPQNLTITPGGSANSTISLTSLNGFNSQVTLSDTVSSPVIFVTLSDTILSLGAGASNSTILLISVSTAAFPGAYTVTVRGLFGQVNHAVIVNLTVTGVPPPSFSLSSSPTSLTLVKGSSVASTISLLSLNGFTGIVILFSTSTPAELVTNLNPANITLVSGGTSNAILTISTTSATLAGTYQVTVTGTTGNLIRSITLTVTVTVLPDPPDFTITVSPPEQTIHRGSTATFAIMITGTNGFSSTVSLSATITPRSSKGPVLALPFLVGQSSNSTLTAITAHNTPRTTYAITIQATSGSITHTFTVLLTVTR